MLAPRSFCKCVFETRGAAKLPWDHWAMLQTPCTAAPPRRKSSDPVQERPSLSSEVHGPPFEHSESPVSSISIPPPKPCCAASCGCHCLHLQSPEHANGTRLPADFEAASARVLSPSKFYPVFRLPFIKMASSRSRPAREPGCSPRHKDFRVEAWNPQSAHGNSDCATLQFPCRQVSHPT